MSELQGHKEYTSEEEPDDGIEESTDKILQKGLNFFRDDADDDHKAQDELEQDNEDSLQADDEYGLDSNNEEAKQTDEDVNVSFDYSYHFDCDFRTTRYLDLSASTAEQTKSKTTLTTLNKSSIGKEN